MCTKIIEALDHIIRPIDGDQLEEFRHEVNKSGGGPGSNKPVMRPPQVRPWKPVLETILELSTMEDRIR
ncbi:hypothetical protein HPP92_009964 [Vanilla planifolia]|uniref:Uncharacterized protein n=1 Tax=Vanilla planifolia TaxID=51239 RepID=A0A835QY22_VANPL|nr:hypothetical protein HPP92_009964 [Vanilla planifolia]